MKTALCVSLLGASLLAGACEQRDVEQPVTEVRSAPKPRVAEVRGAPTNLKPAPMRAYPESETPCEDAWQDLEAIFVLAESRGATAQRLDQASYLEACRALPAAMQQCLGLRYARANRDRCNEVRAGLTADEKAKMKSLVPIPVASDSDGGTVVNDVK